MKRLMFALAVFFITGCSVNFSTTSDNISYDIGITGYGIPSVSTEFSLYGEGCACFDELPEDIHVDYAFVNLTLINSTSSEMEFELMISSTGLTDCGEDTVYYEYRTPLGVNSNKPSYLDSAEVLFRGEIQPGDTVVVRRSSLALREGIENGKVWVIVKNVSTVGISGFSSSDKLSITFSVEVKGKMDTTPLEGLERMVF
ncbi:hypothetical protein J7J69_00390 [candidate division WOR-3 bacterium]|nr:hypothetical protein [candidate division WOR-3 bacterium]